MKNYFDIYIVGVGGQGVLTIADIITLSDMDDIKSPTAMHDKP